LTLEELKQQFGTGTERRMELYEVFPEWLGATRSTSLLRQVWVFGSFASAKPGPGDPDLVALFAAGFDATAVAAPIRHWFDHEITEATPPEVRAMILETFGRGRDGQESIVEVLL
jgi:hypothetical protein